jgi:DNA-binding MarR family transcriptional regulator
MTAQELLTLMRDERLSPSAAAMLIELAAPGVLIRSASTMARILHCSSANITGVSDNLLGRGLIRRHKSTDPSEDRRVTGFSVTDAGRALLARHTSKTQSTAAA